MSHTVTSPTAPFLSRTGALRVHQVPAWQDNLIWILECTATGYTAVVDGPESEPALAYLHAQGLSLSAIFNTHTHGDHIGINRDLENRGLLTGIRVVGSALSPTTIPGLTEAVNDGDTVVLGDCEGRVLLTEGHMNGHISFVFDGVLFCGDTLFTGGCGYLFDGPADTMYRSLTRLSTLEPDTLVCCAHEYTQDNLRFALTLEPENGLLRERCRQTWVRRARGESVVPSTIELELHTNPFLRTRSSELIGQLKRLLPEADLGSESQVFAATRKLKDLKHYRDLSDSEYGLAEGST